MAENKKTVSQLLAELAAKAKGKPKALTLQDSTGAELVFETENTAPAIGDKATLAGQPVPDGKITMPDDTVYVFVGSALTEIIAPQTGDNSEMEARVKELEENLGTMVETVGLILASVEKTNTEFKALAKTVKSTYVAPQKESNQNIDPKGTLSMSEKIKQQREAAKAKKEEGK